MKTLSNLKKFTSYLLHNIIHEAFRSFIFWLTTLTIFLLIYLISKDENSSLLNELSFIDPSPTFILSIIPFVLIGSAYLALKPKPTDKKPKKIFMCYSSIITKRLLGISIETSSIFFSLFIISGFHLKFLNNSFACLILAITSGGFVFFKKQNNADALSAKVKTSPQK